MSPSDDQKRKNDLRQKFLRGFDEQALKGRQEQQEIDTERRKRRQSEDAGFAARGTEGIAEEARREKLRKLDEARWRKDEQERKRELERFKQKKQEEERYFKEMKEKERVFEEKKQKYFNSLHEAAAAKALAERAEFQANQELDKDLDAVDHEARDEKAKAERECTRRKEQVERERLAERDRLDRVHRDELVRLHGEELRRGGAIDNEYHSTLAAAGSFPPAQQGAKRAEAESQHRVQLSALQREIEKKRQTVDAEFATQREAANRDALRERSHAETALTQALQDIEAQRQQARTRLLAARDRTRRKLG